MKKLLSLLIIATIITSSLCVSYFAIDDNSTQNNTTESTTVPVTETSSTVTTEPVTESSTVESSTEPTTESSTEPTTESSTVPTKPAVVEVKTIKLNKNNVTLINGKNCTLKATITPKNATNKEVTWSSSNKNIATVDKNGKVVAKRRGTCKITVSATDGSGVKAFCKVTVKQLVTSIKLNKSVINLNRKGNKATLKVIVKPNNANNKKVIWKSESPKNVSVNKKGTVKAQRNSCYSWVFVKATDGSKKGIKVLVVVGRKANKVEIGKKTKKGFVKLKSMNITSGKSFTFSKKVTAKNNKSVVYGGVTWKSSNPKVLTVNKNGKITAIETLPKNKKYVEVNISAKTMDGSNKVTSCKVRVCQSVKDLYVSSKQAKEVPMGRNVKFNVGINPSNVYNRKLTFSSNKTSVATVDDKGHIKGIKKGYANITAKATDGSNEKVVMQVRVIKVPIKTVTYTDKKEVNVGNTLKLGIGIEPKNASYDSIKYSSSNEKVATVSNGVVKGISRGKATIKASIKLGDNVIKTIKFNIKVNPKPITMNTRLTHKQFVSNKEYVDMYCKALNDYFESCGAVINPNMVGGSQWCVDDTSEFSDNMKIYDFMVESVGLWTHRMAKDTINNNGSWKDLKKGKSLTDFLEEIGRISSSNMPTYNPEKMLDANWNGWKQVCEYDNSDRILNIYVYPSKINTSAGTEYIIYMYYETNASLKHKGIPLVKE